MTAAPRCTTAVARSASVPLEGFRGLVAVRTSACAYVAAARSGPSGTGSGRAPVTIVVHGAALAAAPSAVVVDDDVLADPDVLAAGRQVRVEGGRLVAARGGPGAGALTVIDLGDVPAHVDGGRRPVAAPAAVVAGRLRLAAARRLLPETPVPLAGPLDSLLDVLGRAAGDPGQALDGLVGLGPGLTPAGDDVVVGVLAALHAVPDALGPPDATSRLAAGVLGRLHATTVVSAFYLERAADGRFGVALLDARDRLVSAGVATGCDPSGAPATGSALARLRAVGASSGSDLLVGLVAVLDRWTTRVALGRRPAAAVAS